MTDTVPKPDPATLYTWHHPDWPALFGGDLSALVEHNAAHHRRRVTIRALTYNMLRALVAGEIVDPLPAPPRIVLDDKPPY